MKAMDCRFIILVDSVVEFLSFDLIVYNSLPFF